MGKGKRVLGLHKSEVGEGGDGTCEKLCIPVTSDNFTNPTRAVCQAMETQQITIKSFLLLL